MFGERIAVVISFYAYVVRSYGKFAFALVVIAVFIESSPALAGRPIIIAFDYPEHVDVAASRSGRSRSHILNSRVEYDRVALSAEDIPGNHYFVFVSVVFGIVDVSSVAVLIEPAARHVYVSVAARIAVVTVEFDILGRMVSAVCEEFHFPLVACRSRSFAVRDINFDTGVGIVASACVVVSGRARYSVCHNNAFFGKSRPDFDMMIVSGNRNGFFPFVLFFPFGFRYGAVDGNYRTVLKVGISVMLSFYLARIVGYVDFIFVSRTCRNAKRSYEHNRK